MCNPFGEPFTNKEMDQLGIVPGSIFEDVFSDSDLSDEQGPNNNYTHAPLDYKITNKDTIIDVRERKLNKYKAAKSMRLEIPGNFIRFFMAQLGLSDFFKDLKRKQESGDPNFKGIKMRS